jgi:hypothetical protein
MHRWKKSVTLLGKAERATLSVIFLVRVMVVKKTQALLYSQPAPPQITSIELKQPVLRSTTFHCLGAAQRCLPM